MKSTRKQKNIHTEEFIVEVFCEFVQNQPRYSWLFDLQCNSKSEFNKGKRSGTKFYVANP